MKQMDTETLHQGNRNAWDRTAREVYLGEVDRDIHFLREGGMSQMTEEVKLLGDLDGKYAIHLQCSHGLDGLSLLNLGAARVTGVDISQEMLAQARQKSEALNANASWIHADILETPAELDGTADLVYTGKGAIYWIMDLDRWASVVARLLVPGGKLFLFEGHPLDSVWEEEADDFVLRPGGRYFQSAPQPEFSFPYQAALRDAPEEPVTLTSRVWTLGQVVTAVVNAGLRIKHLEEFPIPFWDQFKSIPEATLHRLPHTFALIATR